ncbi:MAG: NUDIX domain-containing protein [Steroidobacteraceae bacterium]|jgi:8-oxo-dGTP pyrophosphatase MutT (NUDIX family)
MDYEHNRALRETGFWGRRGAGCLFLARDTGRLCIAHRSRYVQSPNTWGTWGGALDGTESAEDAVLREAREESGYDGPVELQPLFVFRHASGFSYHNYLALVPGEFEPRLNWETSAFVWTRWDRIPDPRHAGLEALLADAASLQAIVLASGSGLAETG